MHLYPQQTVELGAVDRISEIARHDGSLLSINELISEWKLTDAVKTMLTELEGTGMIEFISDGNPITYHK